MQEKLFHFWFNTFFIEEELDKTIEPGSEMACNEDILWSVRMDSTKKTRIAFLKDTLVAAEIFLLRNKVTAGTHNM